MTGIRPAQATGAERVRLDGDPSDAPGTGPLHRLLDRTSPLDRLVADAGPLGKFRTDAPDRMPSGTSALTLKVGDALNRLAARLGLPGERILSGQQAPPSHAPRPAAEITPGHGPTEAAPGVRLHDIRLGIAAEADNKVRPSDRGNARGPDA